jgi:hypothetical protein
MAPTWQGRRGQRGWRRARLQGGPAAGQPPRPPGPLWGSSPALTCASRCRSACASRGGRGGAPPCCSPQWRRPPAGVGGAGAKEGRGRGVKRLRATVPGAYGGGGRRATQVGSGSGASGSNAEGVAGRTSMSRSSRVMGSSALASGASGGSAGSALGERGGRCKGGRGRVRPARGVNLVGNRSRCLAPTRYEQPRPPLEGLSAHLVPRRVEPGAAAGAGASPSPAFCACSCLMYSNAWVSFRRVAASLHTFLFTKMGAPDWRGVQEGGARA